MNPLNKEQYLSYSVDDFLLDDDFQQWVQSPDALTDKFWQQFLQTYPFKEEEVTEAREIIAGLQFQERRLSPQKKEVYLHKIYQKVEERNAYRSSVYASRQRKYAAMAAAVSLLLIPFIIWLLHLQGYERYETGYLETKNITLEDGTRITLNANSSLKASVDPESTQPREVWLEGEAFFEVQKLKGQVNNPAGKFIVHTTNLDVEVLGTTFNVSSRDEDTKVMLQTGRVKVESKQIPEPLMMEPGELVELTTGEAVVKRKVVQAKPHTAWKENIFLFENTPLESVGRQIENYYGLKVVFEDPSLKTQIFTAKVSREDKDILFQLIEESFHVTIKHYENRIVISR